jgi:hypothetical protein
MAAATCSHSSFVLRHHNSQHKLKPLSAQGQPHRSLAASLAAPHCCKDHQLRVGCKHLPAVAAPHHDLLVLLLLFCYCCHACHNIPQHNHVVSVVGVLQDITLFRAHDRKDESYSPGNFGFFLSRLDQESTLEQDMLSGKCMLGAHVCLLRPAQLGL